MRLLSQNKRLSIEFEKYDVYVDENTIVAASENGKLKIVGEYVQEGRAMEVMQKIHDDYKYYRFDIYKMPSS